MADKKETRPPDYTGGGLACWVKENDKGKYLVVQVFGQIYVTLFKHTPKPKPKPIQETNLGLL